MNTRYFSLALLASAVMARNLKDESGAAAFQEFIGTFNKHYDTLGSMHAHMQTWLDNKATVEGLNIANQGTGVTFKINQTSDLNDDEFKRLLGKKKSANAPPPAPESSDSGMLGGGRRLNEDMSVNWITKGKVHPVK